MFVMKKAHQTITNALSNVLAFSWSIVIAFAITPFILSALGDDQYGVYTLLLSVIGILSFLDLGLASASVRYISEAYTRGDTRQVNKVISTNLIIFLGLGVVLFVVVMLGADSIITLLKIPEELRDVSKIGLLLAVGSLLFNLANGVLSAVPRALQKYHLNTIVVLINAMALTAVLVFILWLHPSLLAILLVNAATSLTLLIGYIILLKRLLPDFTFVLAWDKRLVKKIMNFAGFTFIATIAGNMLFQFDKFLISAFLGSTVVTFYAIPVTIAMKIHALIATLNNVLFPLSTELFTQQRLDALRELYIRASKFTYTFILAMVIPLIVYAEPFIGYWLGDAYIIESAYIMQVLVVCYGLYALTAIPFYFFAGFDKPKTNAAVIATIVISNIALTATLIPIFNIEGAAYGLLIAQWPVPIYIYMIERKLRVQHTSMFMIYVKLLIIGSVGYFVLGYSVSLLSSIWGVLLALLLAGVFILLLGLVIGIFSKKDRMLFTSYISKIIPSRSKV